MDLCWQSNGSGFQHAVSLQLFIFLSSFHETDPVYFISLKIMFYLRTGIILYGMDIGIRLFLLWLHPFIFSGVISTLISSSILGTYQPGELIFHCHIFLPFHTVHGALKARILKWFAIPFSIGPCFVRTCHQDLSILGGPTWHSS